ncbi:RbsD/FucU domain-containing protein [Streptomyces sp. bgisy154]|uniref:RbsD/FucU domain-containing protein n=1 Tax=Streptomyces sp. bgisy154 TaxID=3413794 RepID=UPI003D72DE65
MARNGILNRHLSGALAELGHGNGVLGCDAGYADPRRAAHGGPASRAGVPSFAEVLEGLPAELAAEGATAAAGVRDADPAAEQLLAGHFPGLTLVPPERLKEPRAGARLVARTGEAPPYAYDPQGAGRVARSGVDLLSCGDRRNGRAPAVA